MKKSLVGVIIAFVSLITPLSVRAEGECSYSEQARFNTIAANVKANYEAIDIYAGKSVAVDVEGAPEIDVYVKGLKINVLNITDDIYIEITNNSTKDLKRYTFSDATDGIITFNQNDIYYPVTYTIEIFADNTGCAGQLIRKFDFITPQYNYHSELEVCNTYPDFYYCQDFISGDNISRESFNAKIKEYSSKKNQEEEIKQKEKTIWEKIKEFYHKNNLVINIIGGLIVISGVTATVMYIRKRRSRVL